ncbi:MAG: RecQ family ATP-dependent DNA helicase [Dehalococcoidia bacterium]
MGSIPGHRIDHLEEGRMPVASGVPERCPACDASLAASAVFCDECGARPDDTGEAPPPPEDSLAAEPTPAPVGRPAPPATSPDHAAAQPPLIPYPVGAASAPPGTPLPLDLEPYRERLRETFGYPEFRDGQARVIEALGRGDVLAVMPTGSGKSMCYVLPALEVGRTVVVSPLIALMQDQVESLQAAGVSAAFINSNLDRQEQNRRYREFTQGRIALLYVAPERFANPSFTNGLAQAGVNLLAIDEAHCISEWGHNFRPDYLQLGAIRERLGQPRTLALTATANPQVRRDITARLGIAGDASEVVTTVDRPNLTYAVERIDGLEGRRQWVVDYARAHRDDAGVVYARTRRGVDELAESLRAAGIHAEAYHAGLGGRERARVQRAFTLGTTPVIVATNAFGMGIDKPDVRYVVHLNMPGRLEAYYQEAGRAGRDGDPAECTLLYARAERRFQQRFIDEAHPDDEAVRGAWRRWVRAADPQSGRLPYDTGEDDPDRFGMIVAALRDSHLLDPVALRVTSFDPDAAIDTSAVTAHRAYAEARLREMAEYAETSGCRRAVILRYFGEQATEGCGNCDNCLGRHTAESGAAGFPEDLHDTLIDIRDAIAQRSRREPSRVFENRTARELATYRPRDLEELRAVWGIGEVRASWFGAEVLEAIGAWETAHPDAPPRPALGAQRAPDRGRPGARDADVEVSTDDPLFIALRIWRSERARAEGVPAYTLFSDRTLRELVAQRPASLIGLGRVWGLGESRVRRFGTDLIEVIRSETGSMPGEVARSGSERPQGRPTAARRTAGPTTPGTSPLGRLDDAALLDSIDAARRRSNSFVLPALLAEAERRGLVTEDASAGW